MEEPGIEPNAAAREQRADGIVGFGRWRGRAAANPERSARLDIIVISIVITELEARGAASAPSEASGDTTVGNVCDQSVTGSGGVWEPDCFGGTQVNRISGQWQ